MITLYISSVSSLSDVRAFYLFELPCSLDTQFHSFSVPQFLRAISSSARGAGIELWQKPQGSSPHVRVDPQLEALSSPSVSKPHHTDHLIKGDEFGCVLQVVESVSWRLSAAKRTTTYVPAFPHSDITQILRSGFSLPAFLFVFVFLISSFFLSFSFSNPSYYSFLLFPYFAPFFRPHFLLLSFFLPPFLFLFLPSFFFIFLSFYFIPSFLPPPLLPIPFYLSISCSFFLSSSHFSPFLLLSQFPSYTLC